MEANRGANCHAGLSRRAPEGTYRIGPDAGRDNKRLGVMDDKGVKKTVRALHNGFFSFDKVQHVDTSVRPESYGNGE